MILAKILDNSVENISKFDIGIMPLEDSPWEQGKCAYKLIQYMACGIPVVASAVGMNKDVVKEHITGFLATTPEHWIVAFETYIKDRNLRIINGCAGFQKVLDEFSLESSSIKLNNILIQ